MKIFKWISALIDLLEIYGDGEDFFLQNVEKYGGHMREK